MLAVGQKSGLAWGINPDDGTVMWQHRVGPGTALGGIEWGGAADDRLVYYPNADGLLGMKAAGGLAAIRLGTGKREWCAPPIATIAGGMVFTTSGYGSFGQMAGNVLLAFGVQ